MKKATLFAIVSTILFVDIALADTTSNNAATITDPGIEGETTPKNATVLTYGPDFDPIAPGPDGWKYG